MMYIRLDDGIDYLLVGTPRGSRDVVCDDMSRGTRDNTPDSGVNFRAGVDDLPDSILELIFLYTTRDEDDESSERVGGPSQRAIMLVQGLANVNRRFRRIVFNGSLWSASDLSSVLQIKASLKFKRDEFHWRLLLTVLSRLDLSKVKFTGSKFRFPLDFLSPYPFERTCLLFDFVGPYIQELDLVGFDMASVTRSFNVLKAGVILERCPCLSSLTLGMLQKFQCYFSLMKSFPLRELQLKLHSAEDMATSMSTISTLWPNLQELLIDISHRDIWEYDFEIPLSSQLPLAALVFNGGPDSDERSSSFPKKPRVLRNIESLLLKKSLVTLDLSHCSGFPEIVLEDDDHLEKVRLHDCRGLWRIVFRNCRRLKSLSSSGNSDCTELCVETCPALQSLCIICPPSRNCPMIEHLNAARCPFQSDDIANLLNLTNLKLGGVTDLGSSLVLSKTLVVLHLTDCTGLPDIFVVENELLREVKLQDCEGSLRTEFRNCTHLRSLIFTGKYSKRPELHLENCPLIETLDACRCSIDSDDIAKLQNLEKMTLMDVQKLDVSELLTKMAPAPRLLKLSIHGIVNLPENIAFNLATLQELSLKVFSLPTVLNLNCPALEDLIIGTPYYNCRRKIQSLDVSVCSKLRSISIDPKCTEGVSLDWIIDLLKRNRGITNLRHVSARELWQFLSTYDRKDRRYEHCYEKRTMFI